MGMFNQPFSFGSEKIGHEKELPQDKEPVQERPSPEKVSPTQQGKFLNELEKKDKKKDLKEVSTEGKEEGDVEETNAGIFGLAGKLKVKDRKGGLGKGSDGSEEGGQESSQQRPTSGILPQQIEQAGALSQTKPLEIVSTESENLETTARPVSSLLSPVSEPSSLSDLQPEHTKVNLGSEKKERVAFLSDSSKKGETQPLPQIATVPNQDVAIKTEDTSLEDAAISREALIELFKQTVDAVTTVVTQATTTTVVTIKQPPIFEGASILVTEYSSAKKEYNITFSNLSPDARRLIETTGSETQLRQALIDKGYTLHMMSIETQPYKITPVNIELTSAEDRRRERSSTQGERQDRDQRDRPSA